MSPNENVGPLLVSVKRGEELLSIGHTKFYKLLNNKELETVTIGRRRLIVYASIKEYLQRLMQAQAAGSGRRHEMAAKEKAPPGLATGEAGTLFPERKLSLDISQPAHAQGPPVLGVDIGVCGALAILGGSGELHSVSDMPVLRDGPKGRSSINGPLLAEIIAASHVRSAFVEFVGPRPKEGAVGAFAFGRARGLVEGVCAALGVSVTFLTPPAWKRIVGIPPGREGAKDAARAQAIRRWPSQAGLFARVKDDGRAESALIALAGLMREGRRD